MVLGLLHCDEFRPTLGDRSDNWSDVSDVCVCVSVPSQSQAILLGSVVGGCVGVIAFEILKFKIRKHFYSIIHVERCCR